MDEARGAGKSRPIGRAYPNPILVPAVAVATGIVIRAVGNARARSGETT